MKNVFWAITLRSSTDASLKSGEITRFGTLVHNVKICFSGGVLTCLTLAFVVFLLITCLKKKPCRKRVFLKCGCFGMIAMIPVLWILLMANHSEIHTFFTFRNLVPGIFAILSGLTAASACDSDATGHI